MKLSKHEESVLHNRPTQLHDRWFWEFYALYNDICQEKVPQQVEAKRVDRYYEGTVQGHFYGTYGLEAELIDAGHGLHYQDRL